MTYVQVPASSHGPVMSYVDRLVIHGTVSPTRVGQAVNDARYVNSVGLSVHYFIDPGTTVSQLPENVQGFHDGYNLNSIGMELCDPQAGPGSRWQDADHEAMLVRAAALAHDICGRWNIPTSRIQADLRQAPTRGIHGHADSSQTWHLSTHVDPGPDFPWDHFIALVNPSPIVIRPTPSPVPTDGSITVSDGHLILWGTTDGAPDATNSTPSLLKLNGILNQLVAGLAAQTAQQAQLAATLVAQGKTLAAIQAQAAAKP